MNFPARLAVLCLLCWWVGTVNPAVAQTRSDTGRHKVEPKVDPEVEAPVSGVATAANPWSFSLTFGGMGGSQLFEVESLTGSPILWDPPAGPPFNARRFETNLERGLNLGLYIARDLGTWFMGRASVSYARMDISAEALMGEDGAILLFARPDVFTTGLGGRVKLVKAASHPFLSADLVWVALSGVGGSRSLDQTNLGYRVGGGFIQQVSPAVKVWAEARFMRSSFDIGGYRPDTPMHDPDTFTIEGETHLSFFEVLLGVEFRP